MTDLGRSLRDTLATGARLSTPAVVERDVSTDGTTKFVLALADRRRIEAVYIPDTPKQTFCISTQVGCAMKCAFCLTGKMGLARNLTAGEIAGQVRVLARETGLLDRAFNIVLMGMGEPLHNYDETMKALRILNDEQGLAVSLHATTDEMREQLVPVNRKYGLQDLMDACRMFPLKRRNRITFEYVLLEGVNDTPEDARRLVALLAGSKAKVNLLPLNEAAGIPFTRPSDARVNRFAGILADHHVTVMVRKSRGRDIRAACGQLIVEGTERSPAQRLAERI